MQDNPVALVTGANQGIGLQIAKGASEAARVALLGPDGPIGTFTHAKLGTLPW